MLLFVLCQPRSAACSVTILHYAIACCVTLLSYAAERLFHYRIDFTAEAY